MESGYILDEELTRFADGCDVGCGGERGVKSDSGLWAAGQWPFTEKEKTSPGAE